MRKLILFVLLLSSMYSVAQITDTAGARLYINTQILPNNANSITGAKMNTALNGILNSLRPLLNTKVDSVWSSGSQLFVRKNGNTQVFNINAGVSLSQFTDSVASLRSEITAIGAPPVTSVFGRTGAITAQAGDYSAFYPTIQRLIDSAAAVWSRVQSTYQVAQANYSTTYSLSNDIRDSLSARYTKAQSDARFLQSFTESDPVWTAAAANYYTKTQADARYLQSFTETDPTVYAWAKAATKPAYAVAEITGLQTALDGKEPVLGFTPVPNTRTINGYALSSNISLSKTDVGLGNVPNTDATNPANISQSASYRFVTDTEKSTWNAKQNALGFTPENAANKGQANGYADLDANGKVPASRIDFSQTGQTFVVASQSAMLAVSGANVGAMAIRTDQSRTYVLIATPASTLSNWVQLLSPDAPVQSVNGQTGNVNLLTTNIGEGTNLYYTDARARAALSAGTGISYNNTTGQISSTITQYTDALARASLSFAAGSGGYNSSTGVITIPTNTNQLTNSAGFITSASLSSYLPLSGGTMTGVLSIGGGNSNYIILNGVGVLRGNSTTNTFDLQSGTTGIRFRDANNSATLFEISNTGTSVFYGGVTATEFNGSGVGLTGTASSLSIGGNAATVTNGVYTTGSYSNPSWITSLAWSKITSAPSFLTGNQTITLSGDATGSGATSIAVTLANSGVTAGTYTKVTVDAKGRVTTGTTLASADLPTYTGTLTSSQVTTALGFTPANSSALSSYLPLSGGTLTGALSGVSASFGATASTPFSLTRSGTNGVYFSMLDGSGNTVFIGSDNGDFRIQTPSGGFTNKLLIANGGAATFLSTVTATGFFESSDIRLKHVFQTYSSADEINTIQYTFKGEFKVKYGYSAQQVQKIIPSAVEVGSDGFYKVDYTSVHSYKIMMLEKRIAELERRVNNGLPEQGIKISY